jgi:acyl transferase domain-containing protein
MDTTDSLADVCHTAMVRRCSLDHRLAVTGRDRLQIVAKLDAYLVGEARPGLVWGEAVESRPKMAFVFCGQGAQWWGMGRELLRTESVFRDAVERIDRLVQSLAGWSLLEQFATDESTSKFAETEVAQPALFAMHVGLAALWRSWGVEPDSLVGHSVGEIAAAHVAGILTLEDAVRLVVLRGRIMQQATGLGKMAMVELSAEIRQEALPISGAGKILKSALRRPFWVGHERRVN